MTSWLTIAALAPLAILATACAVCFVAGVAVGWWAAGFMPR